LRPIALLRTIAALLGLGRHTFIGCVSNIHNVDGKPTQLSKGDPNYVDYYGRPWAQVWSQYFEKGWDKPDEGGPPADVLDLFK
jgi:hypothetical protein